MKLFPVMMEAFGSVPEPPQDVCLRHLRDSVLMVAVYGIRYGSTDGTGVSMTEREFDFAVANKIPVLAYFVGDEASVEPAMLRLREKASKFLRSHAATPSELAANVAADLANVLPNLAIKVHRERAPKDFAGRAHELSKALEALDAGRPVGITGLQGTGKTAMLLAVLDAFEEEHGEALFLRLNTSFKADADEITREVSRVASVQTCIVGIDDLPPGVSLSVLQERLGKPVIASLREATSESLAEIIPLGPLEDHASRYLLALTLPGPATHPLVPLIGGHPGLLQAVRGVLARRGSSGVKRLVKLLASGGLPDLPFASWEKIRPALHELYDSLEADERKALIVLAAISAPCPEAAVEAFGRITSGRTWQVLLELETQNLAVYDAECESYLATQLVRRLVVEKEPPGRLDAVRKPHAANLASELQRVEQDLFHGKASFAEVVPNAGNLLQNAEAAAIWLATRKNHDAYSQQLLAMLVLGAERVRVARVSPHRRAQILTLARPRLEKFPDPDIRASFFHALGRALTHVGVLADAREALESAKALATEFPVPDPDFVLSVRGDLANLSLAEGDAKHALTEHLAVASAATTHGFHDLASRSYFNAASAAERMANPDLARTLLQQAQNSPLDEKKFPMEKAVAGFRLGASADEGVRTLLEMHRMGNFSAFVQMADSILRDQVAGREHEIASLADSLEDVARQWKRDDRLALSLGICAISLSTAGAPDRAHRLSHLALDALAGEDADRVAATYACVAVLHYGDDSGAGYAVRAASWISESARNTALDLVRKHLAVHPMTKKVALQELAYLAGPWHDLDLAWRAYCAQVAGLEPPRLSVTGEAILARLRCPLGATDSEEPPNTSTSSKDCEAARPQTQAR